MKVVINTCYGGFSLSREAYEYLGLKWDGYTRNDEALVACVEALGDKASGSGARLKVVEIPDDVDWYIDEYGGREILRGRSRLMRLYLFECTLDCSPNEGEEFIVAANTYEQAREIAEDNFDEVRYLCELSEEQAEASGLDEY